MALLPSAEEITGNTLFIKSDMWEQRDGSIDWEVTHPASGWSAFGRAPSIDGAFQAMSDKVTRALNDSGFDLSKDAEQIRLIQFDTDTGPGRRE